jgi:hypothetical protein
LQYLTYLFTGICVFTALVYIIGRYTYDEKLLSALGLFIMAIHPVGSAPGILSVIIYSMWINFPMAIAMLNEMSGKDAEINFRVGNFSSDIYISRNSYLKNVLRWMGIFILVICIRHLFVFPYFYDKHYRTEMVYGIQSANTRFIYTSKKRAEAINGLLSASKGYVRKNDNVLAYDAIPMYYFMTETRPFLPNSTPLFYTSPQFDTDLKFAVKASGLPVVVRQKIWLVHEGSGWPEKTVDLGYEQAALNKGRDNTFNNFLNENHYREVWSNEVFAILIPPEK